MLGTRISAVYLVERGILQGLTGVVVDAVFWCFAGRLALGAWRTDILEWSPEKFGSALYQAMSNRMSYGCYKWPGLDFDYSIECA